jgi:hypothetical protein
LGRTVYFDGDGRDDVALGDPKFRPTPREQLLDDALRELPFEKMTLVQALSIPARTGDCAWFSGCAVVYSGLTHEPLFGAWGPSGSMKGLGLAVCALPDLNGDGRPELLVTDEDTAYVFSGSARAARTK